MRWLWKLVRGLAVMTLAGAALLIGAAGSARATAGYGPPPPPVPPVPGGFFAVVTSVTIGPAGGTIGPVRIGEVLVRVRVPRGAFPVPVQITLTAPSVAGIGDAGFVGYEALGGVGVQVQENGSPYPGTFLKPVVLDMTSPLVTRSSIAVIWNGTRFVIDTAADLNGHVAQLTFDTDPDFAVLAPTTQVRGATSATTGKPLLGEGILAGALLLLGAGGIAAVGRRRAAGQ
jgi:hypothetical protein